MSSVEEIACIDRTFAKDFEVDEYLKTVFANLKDGIIIDTPEFISATHTIVRALLVRADFALEQKMMLRQKMYEALKRHDDRMFIEYLGDSEQVEEEVKRTYDVLSSFNGILSPRLNTIVDDLKRARDELKLPVIDDKKTKDHKL